jgi:diguanylate cyclase (GGDEF)-like protein
MFVIFMLASDLSEQMREIAVRDQLTGLLNRRGFAEQTERAYATARRTDRPISVIMADIDHFKSINDEFGHAAGDNALCHFAKILKVTRRADDIFARMGGEEFAIVLPGTVLEEAIHISEDLCRLLKEAPMIVEGRSMPMTASFGVATLSLNDSSMTDAVIRADRALYRSKRAGRSRVDLESSQIMRGSDGTLKPVSS